MTELVCLLPLSERSRARREDPLVFCVPEVRLDDRDHPRVSNELRILLAVESGIESERNLLKRYPQSLRSLGEFVK